MIPSISVVFWNNEKCVEPFLFFLRKSFTQFKYNLFLFDNGSIDRTLIKLKENLEEGDTLLTSMENIGCPKSANITLRAIREKFGSNTGTFFMNSDIFILRTNSLHCMERDADRDKNIGIVYSKIYHPDDWQIHPPGWCLCYIPKKTLDLVGDFDERFKIYYSDTDYAHRIRIAGLKKQVVCGDSAALHYYGESTIRGNSFEQRESNIKEDKAAYEMKWGYKVGRGFQED